MILCLIRINKSLFQVIGVNRNVKPKPTPDRHRDSLKSSHMKTGSVESMKEKTTASNYLKNRSLLSFSNVVSERKEEDEESSQVSKPKSKQKQPEKNILDLCEEFDEIVEEKEGNKEAPGLKDWVMITVFVVICVTNILVNVDHGCIPACTVTIKRDLDLDNASLGVLGAVVY